MVFNTGEAMGSNMSSNASFVVGKLVESKCGVSARFLANPFPEDKKNTPLSRKGKKVIAKTMLTAEVLKTIGRTTPEAMHTYLMQSSDMQALQSGSSHNIHALNALAALYLAFGQDPAYLGECSQSIVVSSKVIPPGDAVKTTCLELTVTIPSLIIGTVGGGTGLPAFKHNLAMVGCAGGEGSAKRLAEVMAVVVLAGELSCCSAHCAEEFVRAHNAMGRNDPRARPPLC
eukprot:TRINITY_DN4648_c0_g1_i1.p1 TRINITY_DN4648_c0_g1~~TRINITY_DN4648_c0_g1_i1.p1  ORF type:complete len:230 (-),score=59.12 TRINITY_DN4648_c0_g1_i1:120-809(-)